MKKASQSACVCWEKNILNFSCFFLCSFTISLLFAVEQKVESISVLPEARTRLRKGETGKLSQAHRGFPGCSSGVRNEEEREETCSAQDHFRSSASQLACPWDSSLASAGCWFFEVCEKEIKVLLSFVFSFPFQLSQLFQMQFEWWWVWVSRLSTSPLTSSCFSDLKHRPSNNI